MFRTIPTFLAAASIVAGGVAFMPTSAARHAAAATQVMHVQLRAQAFSGVTGMATLSYNPATGMTTVKVTVHNLQPGSVHPSHIHAGKCTTNGPVLAALASVTANASGTGTATTVITGSYLRKQAYVNIHLGPGLALTQYTVLACGDLGNAR